MTETALTADEIRAAFRQSVGRIGTTRGYRVRLAAVILGLGVLQLLYLALIGAVAVLGAVLTSVTWNSSLNLNVLTIVAYAAPPAITLIAILFLLKPVLAHPPRLPGPVQVMPEDEPVLFEFVTGVCRALGAPLPVRIYVDLQANASAAIDGWRGLFLGEFNLTIGLPLAADLTLPQLAGLLAHELGHFSQRAGLRSFFLIRTMQHWFGRVVNERDNWDDWLDRQGGHPDFRIKFVARLAKMVVNATRKILGVLTAPANAISCAFSRQMEFDADRYEAALVGPAVFESLADRIPVLGVAVTLGWQDTATDWSVGRLPGDFVSLALTRAQCLPAEAIAQITQAERSQTTGSRDTHPSTAERLANAQRQKKQGSMELQGPAARLFRDLPGLCRRATLHHYEKILGIDPGGAELVSAEEIVMETQVAREFEAAAQRLFHAPAQFCSRWFRIPAREPRETDPAGRRYDGPSEVSVEEFDRAVEISLLRFAGLTICETGRAVNPATFRLGATGLESIREEEAMSVENLRNLVDRYNRCFHPVVEQIEDSVARLLKGELVVLVPGNRVASLPDLRAAWQAYGAISQCHDDVMDVRRRLVALRIVRQNARLFPAPVCAGLLDRLQTFGAAKIDAILARTGEIPASVIFDRSAPPTIGGQLGVSKGSETDLVQGFLSRWEVMSARTLSQLAWFTEAAQPRTVPGPVRA